MAACAARVPYSTETAWPGSGAGRVEARTESEPGPQIVDREGNQARMPLRFLGINADVPLGGTIPRHFHYQVRAADGTVHLLQSEGEFAGSGQQANMASGLARDFLLSTHPITT